MSSLYLSTIGPETKGFLVKCYTLTDDAIDNMTDWLTSPQSKCVFQLSFFI